MNGSPMRCGVGGEEPPTPQHPPSDTLLLLHFVQLVTGIIRYLHGYALGMKSPYSALPCLPVYLILTGFIRLAGPSPAVSALIFRSARGMRPRCLPVTIRSRRLHGIRYSLPPRVGGPVRTRLSGMPLYPDIRLALAGGTFAAVRERPYGRHLNDTW